GLDFDRFETAIATAVGFGTVAIAVSIYAHTTRPPYDRSLRRPDRLDAARSWAGLAAVGVLSSLAIAGPPAEAGAEWIVAGGALGVVAATWASVPVVLHWSGLREAASTAVLFAVLAVAAGINPNPSSITWALVGLALASTVALMAWWRMARESPWMRPIALLGSLAGAGAIAAGLAASPGRIEVFAALMAAALQVILSGIVFGSSGLIAVGPLLLFGAWLAAMTETGSTGFVWFALAVAVVVLAEIEVGRWALRVGKLKVITDRELVAGEWVGLAILAASPIVQMVIAGIGFALVAFGVVVALLVWSLVTRVRRRFVLALVLTAVTAVMTVAVGVAGGAPGSAAFWIQLIGVGMSALMAVGIIDAHRSQGGRVMRRLNEMTEDWK
ncbi:hypothetical protein HQ535_01195, partial [bacterium]|nr:hypothetical protein [bacterium]